MAKAAVDRSGTAPDWEKVRFPSRRGVGLVGCWHPADGRVGVILCHGMESSKEGDKSVAMAVDLARRGIDVLRFDFSYVGESEGDFSEITVSGEVEDLAGAWQYARARVDGPLALVGSSLGGTVALLFAAEQPQVAALATIAAVAVPGRRARQLSEAERERWRREGSYDLFGTRVGVAFLDDVETLDVPAAVGRLSSPMLVTHGTHDEVVPVADATTIAQAAPVEVDLRHYDGADHRFSDAALRSEMLGDVADWVAARLAKTTAVAVVGSFGVLGGGLGGASLGYDWRSAAGSGVVVALCCIPYSGPGWSYSVSW